MSLFTRRSLFGIGSAADLIPQRLPMRAGSQTVTTETAMRHSAVWACLRLRADLISTMPVDVYRRVNGMQVEVPKPPVLVNPGGERVDAQEWLYSTQIDLDRAGNAFGLITEVNGRNLPARIDLVPLTEVSVIQEKGLLAKYRIAGTEYTPHVADPSGGVHPGSGVAREAVHRVWAAGWSVADRVRRVVDRGVPVRPAVRAGLVR